MINEVIMKVGYSYLARQFADPDAILADIKKLVISGDFTLGKATVEFEDKFAKLIGCNYAIGVNSGTSNGIFYCIYGCFDASSYCR